MSKNRKSSSLGLVVGLIVLAVVDLGLVIKTLLHGNNVALFNAQGMIAHEQRGLMVVTIGIMLIIAIPALFLVFFTAWKYRESNTKARHDPHARHGKLLDLSMWLVPTIFMIVLVGIMWPATHRLEPQKSIATDVRPLTIQVVSMRWKWLFIYPKQHIATVNFMQIPVNTPVQFDLTADEAPMSSFWIPNIGGMLYAMTGHTNRLNLMANNAGDYVGSSAEINGAGFAGMKFTARASSKDDFERWASTVKLSSYLLSDAEYKRLLKPSESNPAAFYYTAANSDLYAKVLMKYTGPEGHMHEGMEGMHH